MAFFGVTLETLSKVWPHPDADRLDCAQVEGMDFQFVVARGSHQAGEKVLYFPVDSVLPDWVLEKVGLVGKLSGQGRNRIKTVTLRGMISQGLVSSPALFLPEGFDPKDWPTERLTELLGITKYEPPVLLTSHGRLISLPEGVEMYDIEGADRYSSVADTLMDQPVYISEKVEGTNWALGRRVSGTVFVCQRSNEIEPMPHKPNVYVETAKNEGLIEKLHVVADLFPGEQVVFRGEMIGPKVQGNIYGLDKTTIKVFDIKVGKRYLDALDFVTVCSEHDLPVVPPLALGVTLRSWLNGKTIREASNGFSVLNAKVLREGIVIKPMTEQYSQKLQGRTLLKQRDPIYLAKEKD